MRHPNTSNLAQEIALEARFEEPDVVVRWCYRISSVLFALTFVFLIVWVRALWQVTAAR